MANNLPGLASPLTFLSRNLADLEDLSEREQLMFLHWIVTGVTLPEVGASASSESFSGTSSASFSGERAGPGAEKTRTRKETATAQH